MNKSALIGIVHSYISYKEKLINSQALQVLEIKSKNNGFTLIHSVEFIREIINEFVKQFNESTNL